MLSFALSQGGQICAWYVERRRSSATSRSGCSMSARGQADALPLASRKSVRASIGRTAAKPDANKKPELALLGLPRERPPTIAALAETRRTRWRGLRKAKG